MPVFDLKNADVLIKDGHRATGAVNNAAGYPIGAVTMAVDGFTVAPAVGSAFTVVGNGELRHVITASTTTSLTFTPGLAVAVVDNAIIAVGGRQINAKLGAGNLTFSNTRNREYILNRGVIDEVRDGDEAPVDVSLDAQYQFVTGHSSDPGGFPTLQDALEHEGLATSWISSDLIDPCRPYAVDIELFYEPLCATVYGESTLLQYFRYEKLDYDAKAGTIKVSGKCNIRRAVGTRFDQTP